MNARGKSSPPAYLHRLTGKHVSDSIKDEIIEIQVHNTEYYGGHRITLPAALLKTTRKRKYISEDPYLTYRTDHKGLTLLGVALLDEDKILSINETHKYISSASLMSPEDIKKMSKLTSKIPYTMEIFMEQIKVFKKLLYVIFTASFPFPLKLKEIIR